MQELVTSRNLKELVISCLIICHGLYLNALSALLKTLKFVIQKL